MLVLNIYTVSLLFLATIMFILFNISNFLLGTILILHTLIICIGIYFSIQKRIINIDLIYWIFNYLFFIIPVVVQSKEMYFPTRFPVNIEHIIVGQILLVTWNLIYIVSRNRNYKSLKSNNDVVVSENISYIYFMLSTMLVVFIFYNNGIQYFYGNGSMLAGSASQPIQVLVSSMVYGIVFANFIFLYSRRKKKNKINNILIGIALLELFYIISPFNTNRFNFGFILIFFIWYFYRNSISAYKFSAVLFLGILVVFPFLDIFRYGFNGEFNFAFNSSFDQFKELHFDAFANFLASIEYTDKFDSLLGANLIGTLFFFVPSSFWEGKPEGSGTRIGNYLMDHYGLNFNNLSNPLVSEFYLAFGVIGIIIGAFMFALIINKVEKQALKSYENELLYGILLSYLLILLRGSLIVAFSSIVGSIFFIIILPRFLMSIQDKLNSEKIRI